MTGDKNWQNERASECHDPNSLQYYSHFSLTSLENSTVSIVNRAYGKHDKFNH